MKYLHEDKIKFLNAIEESAQSTGISRELVEKDYYLSELLRLISKEIPFIVFKGGTSLSKCYNVINRFSEDIDLSTDVEISQGQRHKVKAKILEFSESLGLKVTNATAIKSRQNYNRYLMTYHSAIPGDAKEFTLIVEVVYSITAEPTDSLPVQSIIGKTLQEQNWDQADEFIIQPFNIKNQTLERTFIDKIFALADYELRNDRDRQSRHIYDLHMLFPKIRFDQQFQKLVQNVRIKRKAVPFYYSAKDEIDIEKVLQQIYENASFKKDYEKTTYHLLQERLPYEKTIEVIPQIIEKHFL